MVSKVCSTRENLKIRGQSSLGISDTKWKTFPLLCQHKRKWHRSCWFHRNQIGGSPQIGGNGCAHQ